MKPHFFCGGITAFLKIKATQQHTHTHTRMTGPDCVVMCNLINTHTHTHTRSQLAHTRAKACRLATPPEATGPWQKTSAPVCYAEPGGTWRLFLNFSNRPRKRGKEWQGRGLPQRRKRRQAWRPSGPAGSTVSAASP